MLKVYTYIWILITSLMGYEYYLLKFQPANSITYKLQQNQIIPATMSLSTEPGKAISLYLGWIGFGIMLATNFYIIRKRTKFFGNLGSLNGWLNFHILCGLLGPVFIIFHCDFKVRGLVAISFWSMMISFASGIVGRYFYVNLLEQKKSAQDRADKIWDRFLKLASKFNINNDNPALKKVDFFARVHVGAPANGQMFDPFTAMISSMSGDFRLIFGNPRTLPGLPPISRVMLREYALAIRKAELLQPFQQLMGYWHTFHTPFAVFMYVVAVIHIASALFFSVAN